ncbi:NAD(P)-dependent oxidoreductase [Niallia nealsonii]|uniref:NAD(P)-dependent oxidoreductase n=1 Tax=Niallia nealsonii TaxID=115979 RepID=A0A2N0Z749_9BACI|nr:NAD(P)-dependent oxidoreductase [Niallia nealsonii]PKG25345.1 NAD(P)-dependent oxidoreductase [Niallia nealsonii]
MNIGWIGLGNMGRVMAENLVKADHRLFIYNRTKIKAESLVNIGATFCEDPSKVVYLSDVIITMVSDDDAVKSIYSSEGGLFENGNAQGKLFIDMSTVSPETSKSIADKCEKMGAYFLDAPVSGSVKPAKEGNLVIMVGGKKDVYEKVVPVFNILGKKSLYLGDNGSGSIAKLAINLLLGITIQGIAESILFAEKHGITREEMMTIINESAVGTDISQIKTENILKNEYPAAFPLKHMTKDLGLVKNTGTVSPLAKAVEEAFRLALEAGLGEQDVMGITDYLSENKFSKLT